MKCKYPWQHKMNMENGKGMTWVKVKACAQKSTNEFSRSCLMEELEYICTQYSEKGAK